MTENLQLPRGRLISLDAFRGATIASMMLVNNPGDWANVFSPLLHAAWHGWTFTDTIFPFFLWIAGAALNFSFGKRLERGDDRTQLLLHTLRRAAIIFLLGMFLNGFPYFRLESIRIPGVLQRIAICYLIAAVVYLYLGLRGCAMVSAGLLSLYWILMKFVPVPGFGAGVLDKEGNLAHWVDGLLLTGHMWSSTRTWDPEGIVSTLPAIATVLLGILAGALLRSQASVSRKTGLLLGWGIVLIVAGEIANIWLPINKNLWTSSFTIFMAGMASVTLAVFYWLIDGLGWQRWARPFVVFGMNAIAVYVIGGLVARLLGLITACTAGETVPLKTLIFTSVFAPLAAPKVASLLFALTFVALLYLIAWLMYRKRWFLKV